MTPPPQLKQTNHSLLNKQIIAWWEPTTQTNQNFNISILKEEVLAVLNGSIQQELVNRAVGGWHEDAAALITWQGGG